MNIDKKITKSIRLIQEKNFAEAELLLESVIRKAPKNYLALGHLGMLNIFKKKYKIAKSYLIRSVAISGDIQFLKNLVILLMELKEWTAALEWSNQLIKKITEDVNVYINHALIFRELHQHNEAVGIYKKAIERFPNAINGFISYGYLLNQLENYDEALEIYLKGYEVDNQNFSLLYNIAITYLNKLDYLSSIKFFTLAIQINNNYLDLWLTLGVCQAKLRRIDDAIYSIDRAKSLDPKNPLVPFQMGTIWRQREENDRAMECFQEALKLYEEHGGSQENFIEIQYHLGLTYLSNRQYQKAMKYYRYRCKRINNKSGKFDDFDLPVLNNKDSLLVSWEQGIGDEILHMGLLDYIRSKVDNVSYITQDKLYDFIKLNCKHINVIKESQYQKDLHFSKKLNLASLIHYIEDWKTFSKEKLIWESDKAKKIEYKKKYKTKNEKIIGISWKSKNEKIGDEKSFALEEFVPIFQKNKIISLQYGEVKDELDHINKKYNTEIILDNNLDYYNDINSLASLISICDVVVTCSNVTAHLAGRLGINCYVLVPKFFGRIWYWNDDEQSSWYPSVKLIKQEEDGIWIKEIQKINYLINN